jgi:pantothenate kinase-related protein Tda10
MTKEILKYRTLFTSEISILIMFIIEINYSISFRVELEALYIARLAKSTMKRKKSHNVLPMGRPLREFLRASRGLVSSRILTVLLLQTLRTNLPMFKI